MTRARAVAAVVTTLLFLGLPHAAADMCDWAPDPAAKPSAYPIDEAPPVGPLRVVPHGKVRGRALLHEHSGSGVCKGG